MASAMTAKERGHASLAGRPVDRFPVTAIYAHLYQDDHFAELTGLPAWRRHAWHAAPPDEHVATFLRMQAAAPFELLQPFGAPGRAWRERQEFVERDGRPCRHDRQTDQWTPLDAPSRSGHATDYHANETQTVFTAADAAARIRVPRVEDLRASGCMDYAEALVRAVGDREFILTGGVVGTFYCAHEFLGLTNLLAALREAPALVLEISRRLLDRQLAHVACLAAAGGDAIFIDDAMTTNDMISVADYERFCLPFTRALVQEVQRRGQRAIVIYYGGIADRLAQLAALGADGLVMEASMKGYVNDVAAVVGAIGRATTVFGNVDPIRVVQDGSAAALAAELRRQAAAGTRGRGFIIATPSPITPGTPLPRVQRYLELARAIGAAAVGDGRGSA